MLYLQTVLPVIYFMVDMKGSKRSRKERDHENDVYDVCHLQTVLACYLFYGIKEKEMLEAIKREKRS